MNNLHPTMAAALGFGLSVATVRADALHDAIDNGMIGTEADDYADTVVATTLETVLQLAERDRDRALESGDR